MLGQSAANSIGTIHVSNNTIQTRISDMSENIQENLFLKLCMSDVFASPMDESTDIHQYAPFWSIYLWVSVVWRFLIFRELMQTTGEGHFQCHWSVFSKHIIIVAMKNVFGYDWSWRANVWLYNGTIGCCANHISPPPQRNQPEQMKIELSVHLNTLAGILRESIFLH